MRFASRIIKLSHAEQVSHPPASIDSVSTFQDKQPCVSLRSNYVTLSAFVPRFGGIAKTHESV